MLQFFADILSEVNRRLRSRRRAPLRGRRANRRSKPALDVSLLEDRCLLSHKAIPVTDVAVPIPHNPQVPLSSIFWNGEKTPLNKGGDYPAHPKSPLNNPGYDNVPSPASMGAAKTITIVNNSPDMVYPVLRSANQGVDPNSQPAGVGVPYDPQDVPYAEYREFIGYSNAHGKFLGLPGHASMTVQVPLVLWDGDNLFITSDPSVTSPSVYNYDPKASITVLGQGATASGTVWALNSSGFPTGDKPLVMFYSNDLLPTGQRAPNGLSEDVPAQLMEATFRDQYLKTYFKNTDPAQTYPLVNYDVSYVNNAVAPAGQEASTVPIYYGNSFNVNNTPTYFGYQNYGWVTTDEKLPTFEAGVANFIANKGKAAIGQYFGGKGWPQYYNPNKNAPLDIPSGANIFLNSPLNINASPQYVETSVYGGDHWKLTSNGTAPIFAAAGGPKLTTDTPTSLPLNFEPSAPGAHSLRSAFFSNIQQILKAVAARHEKAEVRTSLTKDQNVGILTGYNDAVPITNIGLANIGGVLQGGSGYTSTPTITISGGGSGPNFKAATAHAIMSPPDKDGKMTVVAVATDTFGSGYTSYPTIEFMGGLGKGGTSAVAYANLGGSVSIQLNKGATIPIDKNGASYQFIRPSGDYAATAITNLWYSWAQYHWNQYKDFKPEPIPAKTVTNGSGVLTNEIILQPTPEHPYNHPLAVGMGVKGTDVPKGTTIVSISGNNVFLSQALNTTKADPAVPSLYTFTKPAPLSYDPKYTTPFDITFKPGSANAKQADLFAGSVYETMAAEAPIVPPDGSKGAYLPYAMRVVGNVIQFDAKLPGNASDPYYTTVVGQVRNLVKSILRGVWNYLAIPEQSKWYAPPTQVPQDLTSGQKYNVFNLDPYVWLIHDVLHGSGYAFSVDDDVANPTATGPQALLAQTNSITSLSITSAGSGGHDGTYTDGSFMGGGGAGASFNYTVAGGKLTSITLVQQGGGYTGPTSLPTPSFQGGFPIPAAPGQTAPTLGLTFGSAVTALAVKSASSGGTDGAYTDGTLTGGGGSGATFDYTVDGGMLTGVILTNPGSGYTSMPTANFPSGGFKVAPTLTINLGGENHFPNNLQIGFSGVAGLGNQLQWFPTIQWGKLETTPTETVQATITTITTKTNTKESYITFVGPAAYKLLNQIANPGPGQTGAYITAPGYIEPGDTLVLKGPNPGGTLLPQILLDKPALKDTTTPIDVVIRAVGDPVKGLSIEAAGSGGKNGTYTDGKLTGAAGAGGTFDYTIAGNVLTGIKLTNPGGGYLGTPTPTFGDGHFHVTPTLKITLGSDK